MGLAEEIASVVESNQCLLFAGAGCSAFLEIPTWGGYLEDLATEAQRYEPEIAALMRKRVQEEKYLAAATLFKRILQAPPGDVLAAICRPFAQGTYDHRPLLPLASIPFAGVVTTNYDSSLFEACSHIATQQSRTMPQLLETRDTKGAAYIQGPFVLFLHGRASLPVLAEKIVFDEADYQDCYSNQAFTDGLLQLLSSRKCLFLGFSFQDPGINAVMEVWTKLRGPSFPRSHIAVLPESCQTLRGRLTSMNVRVLTYDNVDGRHERLWESINEAARLASSAGAGRGAADQVVPPFRHSLGSVRDILAMCYARASLGKQIEPLRNLVLDGVVLAEVAAHGPEGITKEELTSEIARKLGMLVTEIGPGIPAVISKLYRANVLRVDGESVISTGEATDTLSDNTRLLAEHVARRTLLREGVKLPQSAMLVLAKAIEDLLMARAWDLAAHYVQPRSGKLPDIEHAVTNVLSSAGFDPEINIEQVKAGLIDLLLRPNNEEAEILADLGRLAFAVQLALGHARSTFAYNLALPQCLYLDASVLMPAIVEGHPLHSVYRPVLERLKEQTADAGGELKTVAPLEFLNEIVSHRRNAIRDITDRGLENPDRLEREVLFYGAENTNVFIGAYASHVGRAKRKLSFHDFLNQFAPYEGAEPLTQFLKGRGISVERLEDERLRSRIGHWLNPLKDFFEREEDGKHRVLVEHEAWQLLRL